MKFNESTIRPDLVFDEYLRLARQDCIDFFSSSLRHSRACPVCQSLGTFKFSKHGFDYASCNTCQTLFIDPCPDEDAFRRFYKESSSSKFWSSEFYKITEHQRKLHLWQPKFDFIKNYVESEFTRYAICDIGCGYGSFLDLASHDLDNSLLLGIEPNADLAKVSIAKGHRVLNCFLQDISSNDFDFTDLPVVYTCFELLEHLIDPVIFLRAIYNLMKPGDYLFLTTLSSVGIDISILGANSKSISPPHHILFINPISAKILSDKVGFSSCMIDTPGRLDFDILNKNQSLFEFSSPYTHAFIGSLPLTLQDSFQCFLSENLLSSHLRLILTK